MRRLNVSTRNVSVIMVDVAITVPTLFKVKLFVIKLIFPFVSFAVTITYHLSVERPMVIITMTAQSLRRFTMNEVKWLPKREKKNHRFIACSLSEHHMIRHFYSFKIFFSLLGLLSKTTTSQLNDQNIISQNIIAFP